MVIIMAMLIMMFMAFAREFMSSAHKEGFGVREMNPNTWEVE